MEWAKSGDIRLRATPSAIGVCPTCEARLRPKCGEIKTWHWAHLGGDCDPWSEPETRWHLNWKNLFPENWQEVVMHPHRADVKTPRYVIELQHSSISSEEIREREAFYDRMIWIFDFRRIVDHIHFVRGGINAKPEGAIAWTRARRSVFACTKPVLIHLGRGRLHNIYGFGYHRHYSFRGGFSHSYTEDQFLTAVGLRPDGTIPPPEFMPFNHVPEPKIAAEWLPYFDDERREYLFHRNSARNHLLRR